MKISTKTRYAIRFLLELALFENDASETGRLTTDIAAHKQRLSEKYLESITPKLTGAGIISSVRGVKGGFALAKPASEIRVGDIMRLMESNFFVIHCNKQYQQNCVNFPDCILEGFWENMADTLANFANQLTLEDLKRAALGQEPVERIPRKEPAERNPRAEFAKLIAL